jgi:hypothetical protein
MASLDKEGPPIKGNTTFVDIWIAFILTFLHLELLYKLLC